MVKCFEQANGLDTALYKNIPFTFSAGQSAAGRTDRLSDRPGHSLQGRTEEPDRVERGRQQPCVPVPVRPTLSRGCGAEVHGSTDRLHQETVL